MAHPTTLYNSRHITTERRFDVTGRAADIAYREGRTTITLRPQTLVLRTLGAAMIAAVDGVAVHGKLVRKTDGGLGPNRVITFLPNGHWRGGTMPDWITAIIEYEALLFNGNQTTYEHQLARGLMEIAEQAMPDTYLTTDSRVQLARSVLDRLEGTQP